MKEEIKIKFVEKKSNFLVVTAELDGEIYDGVLIMNGKSNVEEKKEDEKRT